MMLFLTVSISPYFADAFRKRDAICNGAETGRTVFGYDDVSIVADQFPSSCSGSIDPIIN